MGEGCTRERGAVVVMLFMHDEFIQLMPQVNDGLGRARLLSQCVEHGVNQALPWRNIAGQRGSIDQRAYDLTMIGGARGMSTPCTAGGNIVYERALAAAARAEQGDELVGRPTVKRAQ